MSTSRPRVFTYPVVVTFALLLSGGCVPRHDTLTRPAGAASTGTPELRDDLHRFIKVPSPLQRLATIGPGATEIVCALGAQTLLVGRDERSVYPRQVSRVPVIGSFSGPFLEKLVAVHPQLLLMQGETWGAAQAGQWQSRSRVPVAVLTAHSITATAADIRLVGGWLGRHEQAEALVRQQLLGRIPARDVASLRSRNVTAFFEVARSPQLWTAGDNTLIGDVLRQAGLRNIAGSLIGYKQYNIESLLSRQPRVYVVAADTGDMVNVLREIRTHPVLRRLECVRQGHIVVVNADLVERSGPRLGEGVRLLTEAALRFVAPH